MPRSAWAVTGTGTSLRGEDTHGALSGFGIFECEPRRVAWVKQLVPSPQRLSVALRHRRREASRAGGQRQEERYVLELVRGHVVHVDRTGLQDDGAQQVRARHHPCAGSDGDVDRLATVERLGTTRHLQRMGWRDYAQVRALP